MDINETVLLHNRDNEANFIFIERRASFGYLLASCRTKSEAPPTLSPYLTMVYVRYSRCEALTAVLLKIEVLLDVGLC
jgi:hypothetical protein